MDDIMKLFGSIDLKDPSKMVDMFGTMLQSIGANGDAFKSAFTESFQKISEVKNLSEFSLKETIAPVFDALEIPKECEVLKRADAISDTIQSIGDGFDSDLDFTDKGDMETFIASIQKMKELMNFFSGTSENSHIITEFTITTLILTKHMYMEKKWSAETTKEQIKTDLLQIIQEPHSEYDKKFIEKFNEFKNESEGQSMMIPIVQMLFKQIGAGQFHVATEVISIATSLLQREEGLTSYTE